jgi:hypothetical protein
MNKFISVHYDFCPTGLSTAKPKKNGVGCFMTWNDYSYTYTFRKQINVVCVLQW